MKSAAKLIHVERFGNVVGILVQRQGLCRKCPIGDVSARLRWNHLSNCVFRGEDWA